MPSTWSFSDSIWTNVVAPIVVAGVLGAFSLLWSKRRKVEARGFVHRYAPHPLDSRIVSRVRQLVSGPQSSPLADQIRLELRAVEKDTACYSESVGVLTVTNKSSRRLSQVSLTVPYPLRVEVHRSGQETVVWKFIGNDGKPTDLGELNPRESVSVRFWSRAFPVQVKADMALVHSDGIGRVKLYGPPSAIIAKLFKERNRSWSARLDNWPQ